MSEDPALPPLPLDDPALAAYTIDRELGGGGMSRLFLARDERLGRRVVIKVLAPALAASLSVDRFRREILLATSLQHPNVVPVLSAGDLGGTPPLPFFVMPYVEGESLRERLARGPLSVREAVHVARDVARALAYAHERGVVHRDIKPGNVLLAGGAAVVSDFGVGKAVNASRQAGGRDRDERSSARRIADHTSLTAIGTSLGTPAYMAPEQAAADPNVDHRADLYALGVVLYEMLVGTPPFHGRTPQELLRAQLADAPPPIAARRYDVPVRLAELIAQCLEKDPARRPRSATDVVRWLEDPAVVSGTFAAPPAASARRQRWRRSVLGGGVAALLLAAAAWWATARAGDPSPDDDTAAVAGQSARTPHPVTIGPLTPVGADPKAALVAEGLASELSTLLAAVPGVRVGTRVAATAAALPGRADSAAAAPAPRAAVVPGTWRIEGTVQQEGGRIRVLLRVVDAAADSVSWAAAFDGMADSTLALQSRVGHSVASVVAGMVARTSRGPAREP